MRIRLVSHASVILSSAGAAIWCDPWLSGKAFNASWSLFPEAVWDPAWLDEIDFLWISHEHPDHLHFPTLRALPPAWKDRVTVLYQDRGSEEVCAALRRLGFAHLRLLPHRESVQLSPSVDVRCYHAPYGDSCLVVRAGGKTCVNVNDAQLDEAACSQIRQDVGDADVTLKQFSLAGYTGGKDYAQELPRMAESILIHMANVHRWLGSSVTIPFASFVYFSSRDNAFMNRYANRPVAVHEYLENAGCPCGVLYPGDQWAVGDSVDSASSLRRFDAAFERFNALPIHEPPLVPLDTLQARFASFSADIHDKFTWRRIAVAPPVRIRVPDLGVTLEMSLLDGTLRSLGPDEMSAHLEAGSHALDFAFSERFGFETMTISSRVFVLNDRDWPWILNRDLLWLYRTGIWLKPQWLLDRANARRVWPWARERMTWAAAAQWANVKSRRLRWNLKRSVGLGRRT